MKEKILKSNLFKNISLEELDKILNQTRYQKKKYSKDSSIVFQNDVCIDLILLYTGRAIAEKINYSGQTMIIEEFIAPRVVAPAFIYAKNNYYPVSVYAKEACEVILIPRLDFITALQKNNQLLLNFLEIISEQFYFMERKMSVLKLNLEGKIANYLLTQINELHSKEIPIVSQQHIADIFGVARPSLTRALAKMKENKIIAIKKKKIVVFDMQVLQNLAE